MPETLITSTHPKGRHYVGLCEVVYDKARLSVDHAQCLNESGGSFQRGLGELVRKYSFPFGDEEIESNYAYPAHFKGVKAIGYQVQIIADAFRLSPDYAFEYIEKSMPHISVPAGAIRFVYPGVQRRSNWFKRFEMKPTGLPLPIIACCGVKSLPHFDS